MKILQWNVRSYFARLPTIQALIDEIEPDVLCLQETWLKPGIPLKIRNFHEATRKDRPEGRGGGVSIHIKSHIPRTEITINSEMEVCGESVYVNNKRIGIISLYIPPNYNNTHLLANLQQIIQHLPPSYIIAMDSNAHHYSWGSEDTDNRGRLIDQFITETDLVLLNNSQPTYLHSNGNWSHIDLTIATKDIAPTLNWDIIEACPSSDHLPILTQSNLNCPENNKVGKWKLRDANWKGFRDSLDLNLNLTTPNQACRQLEQKILKAATDNVGMTKPTSKFKYTRCWWSKECSMANFKMKRAYNHYKKHRGDITLWIAFKQARAVFRKTIKEAKSSSWKEFVSKINSNTPTTEVWQMVKKLNGTNSHKAITLKTVNSTITDSREVADTLGQRFSSVSSGTTSNPLFAMHKQVVEATPISFQPGENQEVYNRDITTAELNYAISSCKSKSPGPDSIPFEFIKQLSTNQIHQLLNFYNFVWKTGLPDQWRNTTIVPILKQGKSATDPASYRPVALTNCLCKILEKIVNRRLQCYLEQENYIDASQSGFRAGHSTTDPLARLESSIRTCFIRAETCVAVFLDIEKAFDSVWHVGLLKKLQASGLHGNLPFFIQEFLQSRKISVRISNRNSKVFPIYSGVPQGSVISPTLFTIMINDLFSKCETDIQYSLYADDGAMWCCTHKTADAINKMQTALETLSEWSNKWGLNISPHKTKSMVFKRGGHMNYPPLTLNGANVEYVTAHKFLGVTLDCRLTWGKHITHLKDSCQSKLRLLRIISSCGWGADLTTLRKIYQALILSKIDYASFLLETASPSQLLTLDRIQYAAARIISGALKCTPTRLLEEECQLMTLHARRKMQMAKYAVRVLTIPEHPVRLAIMNYCAYEFYDRSPFPLPVTGRIHKEMRSLEINIDSIATIPRASRYQTRKNFSKATMNIARKQMLTPHAWRAMYNHLKTSQYPDRVEIFSDGALQDSNAAFGVFTNECNVMGRLPNKTSIFTAELFAIFSAVQLIKNLQGNYLLWTDSLSSVMALSSSTSSKHYMIHKIRDSVNSMPDGKLVIEWVPSHVSIEGNEKADELASKALKLQQISTNWLGTADAYHSINTYYAKKNAELWVKNRLYRGTPDTSEQNYEHHSLPRQEQIIISRLRFRTTKITHGHYFNKSTPKTCQNCTTRLTLKHIFVDCPTLAEHRSLLVHHCSSLNKILELDFLLSSSFPPKALIQYLDKTGYLAEV